MCKIQLYFVATMALQVYGSSWDVLSPQQLKAVRGSCLLIPCEFRFPSDVSTPDGITAIWFKDTSTVAYHSTASKNIDGRYQGRTELLGDPEKKNCTLLIKNVANEDAGKYAFRFEIDAVHRWLDAKGVTVTVSDYPGSPEVNVPAHITDGSSITLSCFTPYFCPDSSVSLQWKEGIPERSLISGEVEINPTAVINRQNLTAAISWQMDGKKLRCEVSVAARQREREVTLSVRHSPKGMQVLINPNTKNIKQGDSVSLTCNVNSSNPEVTGYKWFKDGNRKAFSTEQSVLFMSVARSDYGLYQCEAENAIGTAEAQARTLTVFSARTLAVPSSEIREGEMATLTCEVPGGDPVNIVYSWYKNNVWLKEGAARSLVFHETTSGDAGYYCCKVQNDKGSDTSPPITLTIVYPPRTPVITSFLETQEGKLAIIHCTVDSEPSAELALQRNDKLIATTTSHGAPNQRLGVSSTRNSLKLEIGGVVLEDEGMYICNATNAYGTSTTSRHFHVETARVLISPSAEVHEGEMVTLTCEATRSEQKGSSYTWFKNTKWLKESSESALIFPAVASLDAGSYHCKAGNTERSSTSPSNTLHVLYPPRKPLMNTFLEMQGGQLGIIQCSVDSDPVSELALYRRGVLVASTSPGTAPSQRFSMSSSHNFLKLEIQGVMVEDEGKYICSANNTYGSANAYVDFTAETARIAISPSTEICEGEMVNLTCILSSDSTGGENYTWYKNNEWYAASSEQTLVFQQIESKDAGSYYCMVWNKEGGRSSSAITLNVFYAPRNTLLQSFLETGEGRLAIIHCTAESNPPSRLTLYRNDEPMTTSGSQTHTAPGQRLSMTSSRNALKLEIRNVMSEDEGTYACSASNTYGISSQSIYFRVQTARVLVTPSKKIHEGDTVTLTCEVTRSTQEEMSYVWYKNSKWYQEDPKSSLVFQQISSRDTGYYHCRARDKEGSSTSPSISLIVLYGPRNLTISSFLEMQGGQLGIIQCSVDSDPASELALYRRGFLVASTSPGTAPSQRFSVSSSHNSLKLEIRGVMVEDEGTYMCLANNSYGDAASHVNFTADTARILVTPSSEVPEGNTVTLTCAVTSNAEAASDFTWYKNGKWYKQGSEKTLILRRVTSDDAGSYYCKAQNIKGSKSSPPVSLNILYPPRNALMKSFLETGHGRLAIFLCTVNSNPPSELSIFKEDTLLVATSSQGASKPRLEVSYSQNSMKLEIQNVIIDDEGKYTCSANNAYGETTTSVYFTVEGARVVITPATSICEGDVVTLTCDLTANTHPVTSYIWYKNTKWLLEGNTASLVFQAVTSGDRGSYSCAAQSSEESKASPPVTLQVLYPPRGPLITSFLETQRGRLGIIQCTVDSDPPSEVALYRENEMVASSDLLISANQRISVVASHNSLKLEIEDVMFEDQGEYMCSVNNTYGSATTAIYFTVETARVMVEPSPELQEGDTLNLTCVTTTEVHGKANYTWYKNNKWLRQSTATSLVLHKVTNTDTGSYHCSIEETQGSQTSMLIGINVLYTPRDLKLTSFLETQGRRLGIIQCTVDSAPVSKLTLYRNDALVASTSSHISWNQRLIIYSSYNSLTLEISDAKEEDSANYVCAANNTLGSTMASLYFSVHAVEEVYVYKILAWFAVVVASSLLLLIALMSGKMWKRKFEFSKLKTDENTIEMTSNKQAHQTGADC